MILEKDTLFDYFVDFDFQMKCDQGITVPEIYVSEFEAEGNI